MLIEKVKGNLSDKYLKTTVIVVDLIGSMESKQDVIMYLTLVKDFITTSIKMVRLNLPNDKRR